MSKKRTRAQKMKVKKFLPEQVKIVSHNLKNNSKSPTKIMDDDQASIFGYSEKLIKQDLLKTIWVAGIVILVLFGVFYFF